MTEWVRVFIYVYAALSQAVEAALAAKTSPEMRNQALCAAATSNDATLTKTLLDAKADVAWKNADGKTAFDLASAPEIKVLIARAEKAPPVLKGAWTKEEDETVIRLVGLYGPTRWAAIAGTSSWTPTSSEAHGLRRRTAS